MKCPTITIIDYGVGNTNSVFNAISRLGYSDLLISRDHARIQDSDALILPGVGAFAECMHNLTNNNLVHVLNQAVLDFKKPILGICVGMQLMADSSEENGFHTGLGWIPGKVLKVSSSADSPVPHVGWNDLSVSSTSSLFNYVDPSPHFYFDHSYSFHCKSSKHVIASCHYNQNITSAVQSDNIVGVQFHPEKSQLNGLRLFRSFFNAFA